MVYTVPLFVAVWVMKDKIGLRNRQTILSANQMVWQLIQKMFCLRSQKGVYMDVIPAKTNSRKVGRGFSVDY